MKKTIITTIILVSSLIGYSQKDSTKKDTVIYFLTGRIDDFAFLYKALTSPGDITPNQLKALVLWLQKLQVIEPPKQKSNEKKHN